MDPTIAQAGEGAVLLARFQFAFTVSWHFIFPAFTIGLASFLAVLEAQWLRTKQPHYLELFKYWVRIFAVVFGMGVVSGIVMSYQFGTNWGPFADATGGILGPLLGYEVLTAFFLEAGFLGVMLFGLNRVGPKLHFAATLAVAVGTLLSSFWILAANSWMQTPVSYSIVNGIFHPENWFEIVFNPSFPYRFAHTVTGAFLTTAFAVGAVGAWHLLKGRKTPAVRTMFSMAMWMATIVAPLQLVIGDLHGLNTLEYQPRKVAAMEGHWETQKGAPFILFGMPDMEAEKTKYAVEIPHVGSLILTHDWNGEVKGLKDWAPEDRPNAAIVFWSFRIMVGIGLLMILLGGLTLLARRGGRIYEQRWLHRFAVAMGPSGFVAVTAGWVTTEVGRQPYLVEGLIRTSDGVSPVDAAAVAASLVVFIIAYFIVWGAGITYLFRLMGTPPNPDDAIAPDQPTRAAGLMPGAAQHIADADPAPRPAE